MCEDANEGVKLGQFQLNEKSDINEIFTIR